MATTGGYQYNLVQARELVMAFPKARPLLVVALGRWEVCGAAVVARG